MTLTDEEAWEAACRLWRQNFKRDLAKENSVKQEGTLATVRQLAALMECERSPEAIGVFMLWMGEGFHASLKPRH